MYDPAWTEEYPSDFLASLTKRHRGGSGADGSFSVDCRRSVEDDASVALSVDGNGTLSAEGDFSTSMIALPLLLSMAGKSSIVLLFLLTMSQAYYYEQLLPSLRTVTARSNSIHLLFKIQDHFA
mmetsp:Transcript_4139/g.9383  ORF Transcript_4139/g.9383 Transcript_4139/m.9383 type:complete len:124 (+) Transcript_4139:1383-1754(+)